MFNYYKTFHLSRSKFVISMSLLCIVNFILFQPYSINLSQFITIPIQILFMLLAILIMIARYHDIGKSGLYIMLLLIPIIGPIIVITQLTFFRTKINDNPYFSQHDYMKVN